MIALGFFAAWAVVVAWSIGRYHREPPTVEIVVDFRTADAMIREEFPTLHGIAHSGDPSEDARSVEFLIESTKEPPK